MQPVNRAMILRSDALPGLAIMLAVYLSFLAACAPAGAQTTSEVQEPEKLRVVTTTTILGDVVRQVGGDTIQLVILMRFSTDPHTFEPAPQDLSALTKAEVIFASGLGLEESLNRLLNSATGEARIVDVSEGIQLRKLDGEHVGESQETGSAGVDPHVWFDPHNVIIWTQNIERSLKKLDPANAGRYAANAEAYRQELRQLDAWAQDQVAQIPKSRRKLVADHQTLGYFADRYEFEQVGAVIPGFSTASEPSAQELAALEDAIRQLGVPIIFVGKTVNPNLAQRVADDTGIRLVFLYTDSLTPPGGEADSYLALMRYDVNAIVSALK